MISLKHVENSTNILKHGTTYIKNDELQYSYPISFCPECMSLDTTIETDKKNDLSTEYYHYVKHGIFLIEEIYVNYSCNECGCKFCERFTYDCNRCFLTRKLYRKVPYFIISLSIACLSLFIFICSLIVIHEQYLSGIEITASAKLWNIISIAVLLVDFFNFVVEDLII